MAERKAVEDLLDRVHVDRIAGNAAALADLFADDATFQICGLGTPIRGKAAIRTALEALIRDYPFVAFRALKVLVDGDEVAVRSLITIRHPRSGRETESETSDFLTIRDGKITSYTQYVDTGLARELAV